MPVVHRQGGFTFHIYLNDHRPPHVHAFRAGQEAVVEIGEARVSPARLRETRGMGAPDYREAVRIVGAHQGKLLAAWRRVHG